MQHNGLDQPVQVPQPCVMVIFGASGDLTKRMLIPSLYELFSAGLLPENFSVIGFARKEISTVDFRDSMRLAIGQHCQEDFVKAEKVNNFLENIEYFVGNYDDQESFNGLSKRLLEIDSERHTAGNRLFYMSVPS